MNTIQIESFIHVAKFLNFSKAAQAIGLTQPAISHQIQSLETELGVKLFHRTSKSVTLTESGVLFLPDAENILQSMDNAKNKLTSQDITLPLSIGFHNQAELSVCTKALGSLKKEFPTLHPSIRIVPFEHLSSLLTDGQLDLMFSSKKSPDTLPLRYTELFTCPMACVCSRSHPFAGLTSITTEQLQGDFILCHSTKTSSDIFRIQSRIASNTNGNCYYVDGDDCLPALIKADFGYSLLPDIPSARDAALVYLPVTDLPSISFGVYTLKETLPKQVKRFLTLLKETNQFD